MSTTLGTRIKKTASKTALAAMVGAAALAASIGMASTASAEMYGDPTAAAQYWQPQNYDNCALMAVADVAGELSGEPVSEREIINVATNKIGTMLIDRRWILFNSKTLTIFSTSKRF